MNTVVQIKRSVVETEEDKETKNAILPIPSVLDRIVEVPAKDGQRYFIYLEDIINFYAEQFFAGYDILNTMTFRVTRDADLEIDEEEAQDLLLEMEESLRRRRVVLRFVWK